MPRTLFAVKLDTREKESMDMVSETTGATLASLHLGSIRDRLHRNLGYVLLHRVTGEEVTAEDMEQFTSDERGALRIKTPLALLDLLNHLKKARVQNRVRGLLSALPDDPDMPVLPELDMSAIIKGLGEGYLRRGGDLGSPDPALILDITLDIMVREWYDSMAKGSLAGLSGQWEGARGGLAGLREDLIRDYLKEHPEAGKARAIDVRKKRKKPPAAEPVKKEKAKKKGGRRKKAPPPVEEGVEVVEVAPVVEVDEIEE